MKSFIVSSLMAATVLAAGTASAQLTWTDIATSTNLAAIAPSGAQMGGTAVVTVGASDFLYLVGPNIGSDSQNIFYVDVTNLSSPGTWQTATWVSPANDLVYTTNCTMGYNGRLYVVAGNWNSAGVDYNGIRVFAPAASGDITAVQQEFDGSTATPNLTGFASSAALNSATGIIYILAATATSSDVIQRVQIDGGTGNITGSAIVSGTLPVPLRQAPMLVHNGTLYVVGGWNSVAASASSAVYYATIQGDGSLGAFSATTAALPQAVSDGAAAVLDGKLYVLGGCTANSNPTAVDDVFFADISSSANVTAWTADVVLPYANGGIRRIGAAVTDEAIIIVGGRQPDAAINTAIHVGTVPSIPTSATGWETYK